MPLTYVIVVPGRAQRYHVVAAVIRTPVWRCTAFIIPVSINYNHIVVTCIVIENWETKNQDVNYYSYTITNKEEQNAYLVRTEPNQGKNLSFKKRKTMINQCSKEVRTATKEFYDDYFSS